MVLRSMATVALVLMVSSLVYHFIKILDFYYKPDVPDDFCWAAKDKCLQDTKIHPFRINVQKREVDDLISRLANTREFTPSLEGTQNQYGLDGAVLHVILKFIKDDYNFTRRQAFLNQYPQFTTNIQGLNIHFLHVKSKRQANVPVVPMLLLHGWPSSVREFYESIPLLMSEENQTKFAFDLVIPSLTGFGYSDGPSKAGFRLVHAANVMRKLMNRLGYKKFIVHGSDWGAATVINLATMYPDSVLGLHSNFCASLRTVTFLKIFLGSLWPRMVVEDKYESKLYPFLTGLMRFYFSETGYYHLMATKPDTIGHILDNTPEGLIAYMFEKLSVGKFKDNVYSPTAGLEQFDLTTMMDIMLYYYWFPKKATTSARYYCENGSLEGWLDGLHNVPINASVPCACAYFEHEFLYQPENFLRDKFTNLIQYTTYPSAGHFAALEVNDVLTQDIITFVNKLYDFKFL